VRHPLLVEVSQDSEGATVITCGGEIDFHNVGDLNEAINRSMTTDLKPLRLDLSGVGFMESSGLACLLEASATCRRRGVVLQLVPSQAVSRILDLVGITLGAGGTMEPAAAGQLAEGGSG